VPRAIEKMTSSILMLLFLWSGSKLFPFVDVYAPGRDTVRGVAFALSEEDWENMRRDDNDSGKEKQ